MWNFTALVLIPPASLLWKCQNFGMKICMKICTYEGFLSLDMNGTVSHKLLKYPKTWLVIGGSFYSNASVSQLFGIRGLFMFVQRDGIWIRIIFILTMYRFCSLLEMFLGRQNTRDPNKQDRNWYNVLKKIIQNQQNNFMGIAFILKN